MPLVKTHVKFESLKKLVVMYLTPTDKMTKLKRQFKHFFHKARESQTMSHIAVIVSYIDLNDDSNKCTICHYPEILNDDSDVRHMFSIMVSEEGEIYP
jgi:hypothetical protein